MKKIKNKSIYSFIGLFILSTSIIFATDTFEVSSYENNVKVVDSGTDYSGSSHYIQFYDGEGNKYDLYWNPSTKHGDNVIIRYPDNSEIVINGEIYGEYLSSDAGYYRKYTIVSNENPDIKVVVTDYGYMERDNGTCEYWKIETSIPRSSSDTSLFSINTIVEEQGDITPPTTIPSHENCYTSPMGLDNNWVMVENNSQKPTYSQSAILGNDMANEDITGTKEIQERNGNKRYVYTWSDGTQTFENIDSATGMRTQLIHEDKDGTKTNTTYNWNENTIETTITNENGTKTTSNRTLSMSYNKEDGTYSYNPGVGVTITTEENGTQTYQYEYYDVTTPEEIGDKQEVFSNEELRQAIKGELPNQTINDVLVNLKENLPSDNIYNHYKTISSDANIPDADKQEMFKTSYKEFNDIAYQYNAINSLLNEAKEAMETSTNLSEEERLMYEEILKHEDEFNQLLQQYSETLNNWLEEEENIVVDEQTHYIVPEEPTTPPNPQEPAGSNGGNMSGGQPGMPSAPITEIPNISATPTMDPTTQQYINELLEKIKQQEEELKNQQTVTTTESATTEEEQEALDKLIEATIEEIAKEETLQFNEDTFTNLGMVAQQGEEIPNAVWRYYISTDIEIISDVSDYSVYGIADLGTNVNTETNSGTKSIYSHVYDVDGKILQDSVAKSTQTAFAIISTPTNDPAIVNDFAFVRVVGKGNESNYDIAGYTTITLDGNESSEYAYKLLVTANRTSIDEETIVNIDTTSNNPIPDTLKTVLKLLSETMYNTNKNSFIIGNAGTITVETPIDEYKVVQVNGDGIYSFHDEIEEDGYRETWSYCEDQILIKKDGTRYAIKDVLNFDMYSIADLIDHGFICHLNGQVATSEEAKDITFKPSDMENGLKTDSTGKLQDNDSEEVIPEDGVDRDVIAVLDGLDNVDLENAYSEYIYSSNNYDYFIPEGVKDNTRILFTDKDGNQQTLTVAEALAQKYMNADEFVNAMGKVGIDVQKIAKTSTTPDFQLSIKEEENADTELTEIYRDDKYSYSVAGSTLPNRVVVLMADGRKYRLDYILDHNIYSIEELELKGLTIYKKLVAEDVVEEESDKVETEGEVDTTTTPTDTITPEPTVEPTKPVEPEAPTPEPTIIEEETINPGTPNPSNTPSVTPELGDPIDIPEDTSSEDTSSKEETSSEDKVVEPTSTSSEEQE